MSLGLFHITILFYRNKAVITPLNNFKRLISHKILTMTVLHIIHTILPQIKSNKPKSLFTKKKNKEKMNQQKHPPNNLYFIFSLHFLKTRLPPPQHISSFSLAGSASLIHTHKNPTLNPLKAFYISNPLFSLFSLLTHHSHIVHTHTISHHLSVSQLHSTRNIKKTLNYSCNALRCCCVWCNNKGVKCPIIFYYFECFRCF